MAWRMLVIFLYTVTKYLPKAAYRKECGVWLTMWGTYDREGHGHRSMKSGAENADTQLAVSFLSLYSVWDPPACGMVSHTFRVGLTLSVKPLWKQLPKCTQTFLSKVTLNPVQGMERWFSS